MGMVHCSGCLSWLFSGLPNNPLECLEKQIGIDFDPEMVGKSWVFWDST